MLASPKHLAIILILVLSARVTAAQTRHIAVAHQWCVGTSSALFHHIAYGLPHPIRPPYRQPTPKRITHTRSRTVQIPVEFGEKIEWGLYDLAGSELKRGLVHLPETGDRTIQVQSSAGLYVFRCLTCSSQQVVTSVLVFFE